MWADVFTLLAANVMVSIMAYGWGYHDGNKYGRRRR